MKRSKGRWWAESRDTSFDSQPLLLYGPSLEHSTALLAHASWQSVANAVINNFKLLPPRSKQDLLDFFCHAATSLSRADRHRLEVPQPCPCQILTGALIKDADHCQTFPIIYGVYPDF
jgi:hypothetical protein